MCFLFFADNVLIYLRLLLCMISHPRLLLYPAALFPRYEISIPVSVDSNGRSVLRCVLSPLCLS
jgi:hypothetical protein